MKSRYIKILIYIMCLSLTLVASIRPGLARSNEKELFSVAQKAFEDGFYDVAIRYIGQFLEDFPESKKRVHASLLLGQCYFFKNQYLKAYEIFQELLSYSEYKDATLFWLGETYLKGADYKQAEKYYLELIKIFPKSLYLPQAYHSLAWTYYEQEKYNKSRSNFLHLINTFPQNQLVEDAVFKIAEIEYNIGNYEKSIVLFRDYVNRFEKSSRLSDSYFYIAESYYYLKDYLTANTYYAKVADIAYDPKLVIMSEVSMGWSYIKLKRYSLAEEHFTKAFALAKEKDSLYDDIYLGLATLYSEKEEFDKALESYETLIKSFPKSSRITEAHLGRGNILYALKRYDAAIKEYVNLINTFGKDENKADTIEKAYFGLAWTYLKNGNIDASIQTFEKIKNKTKSKIVKVSALTQIGDAYQDTGKLQKAIDIYDSILTEFPESLYSDYVQYRQAIALLKMDKIESATMSFQTLKANFPESKYLIDTEYYLGLAYFKKGDFVTAIPQLEEYLSSKETLKEFVSEAEYLLALSHFNLEEYQRAIERFKSITTNPLNQPAIIRNAEIGIAKCLFYLNNYDESIQKFLGITERFSGTDVALEALMWLAQYSLENSDAEKAIEYYNRIIAEFPGSDKVPIAQYGLGKSYENLGELTQALNYYKNIDAAKDRETAAKAKLAIAAIFSRDLNSQKTIETYQEIINNTPEFKRDAYLKIADIFLADKKYQDAINYYYTALEADQGLSTITNAQLHFLIGDTLELFNKPDHAVEEYLKIPYLFKEETSWVIKALLRVARIFENNEKWDEAKKTYEKIIAYHTSEEKFAHERIEWINTNVVPMTD